MNADDDVLQGVSMGRVRQSGSSVMSLRDTKKSMMPSTKKKKGNNYCESSTTTKTVGMG